jgi:hypothetical protein
MIKNAFIVGSGRSGTTLLGDILDLHPLICRWYEPYFIIDRHFRNAPNDCRTATDANDKVKDYIIGAFDHYRDRRNCQTVIDKSPRNSLKLPFLTEIFPKARFVHIVRDGRDATLSIYREWQKRLTILKKRNYIQAIQSIRKFLMRQPLLEHKFAAAMFEIGDFRDLSRRNMVFQRYKRWDGRIGWGPQFEGWQAVIDKVSILEFSALQWAKCLEAIVVDRIRIESERFLEIRYEDFLIQPQKTLAGIFEFLAVHFPPDIMDLMPTLKVSNYNKWRHGFSAEQKESIGPILQPLLSQFGYADDSSWYQQTDPKKTVTNPKEDTTND